jgi:hypothetical protein
MVIPIAIVISLFGTWTTPAAVPGPPRKILFIGNSLTYSQDGIYTHLARLAGSANPPLAITADKAVVPGASLQTLWESARQPRESIVRGGYDVVVLQEDLPETNVASFREYARRFVSEIRKAGSRPVLMMAWSYQRLGWISMAEIARAHRDAANELQVDVAPVGLAWERSTKQRPDLNLFVADREHPSIYGTYLATLVVYSTVFGDSPIALSYVPRGVTRDAGSALRRIAWEAVQEYRGTR